MAYNLVQKDAASSAIISVNWSDWLGADTITNSAWNVPAGLTGSNQNLSGASTTIRIAGGALGDSYYIVNTVTTASGRTEPRTVVVRIVSR